MGNVDKGYCMSAVLNTSKQDLYKEIRDYLLTLFPAASAQIVQALNNNEPLPENAIVMQALFDRNLDETSIYFDPDEEQATAQNSVDVRLQLSFYGSEAENRSRIVYTLWKSAYTTERMVKCQPLYAQGNDLRPYINDSNQYEQRWICDLALQYNPAVSYTQESAESAQINIRP